MEFSPIIIYVSLVLLLITAMLLLSYVLGEDKHRKNKSEPYESGIPVTSNARLRFPIKFYMVAMFFVIFDLEVVFIVAWAIAFRSVGWVGYVAVFIFISVLSIVLVYEWRTGALDFGPNGRKILKAYKEKIKQDI
ncbi:MAG: NADH-quinone oxidoreductase subunit A [Fulvivirga sp.]|nr:NADH-quinone oxidoreductase subunit A [Fulvivirga sp.]